MPITLHITTAVQPGGKVEITNTELEAEQKMDVVVTPSAPTPRRMAANPTWRTHLADGARCQHEIAIACDGD